MVGLRVEVQAWELGQQGIDYHPDPPPPPSALDSFWPVIGSYDQNLPDKGEGWVQDLELWICMAPISLCGWYLTGYLFFEIIHSDSEEQRAGESCSLVLNNLKKFTFQCSAVFGFPHNLFPYVLLVPTPNFLQCKEEWMIPWVWAGCREKGLREGNHSTASEGGDLLIFYLEFIPSESYLFYLCL